MLDILLFREKPELIRESQRRRFPITEKSTDEEKKASAEAVNQVDLVIKLDKQWKDKGTELNVVNKHSNIVDKVSGLKRKQGEKEGEDSTPLFPEEFKDVSKITDEALQPLNVKQLKHLKVYLSKLTENLKKEEKEAEIARDAVLLTIGNLVMDEVPIADDEVFNKEIKVWGTVKPKQEGEWTRRSHYDIMPMLGGVEYEHGAQIAGDRGYFLKGDLVLLHMAVAHFAMKFLVSKKYCPIFPPFFMNKTVMSEVAQLSQFMRSFTRFQVIVKRNILLLPVNNLLQLFIVEIESQLRNFQSVMQDSPLVSEKKLALMGETLLEYLGFINLIKLSSFVSPVQK